MSVDLNALVAPSNWFSQTIEYVGEGYAEFSKPRGWIKGQTTATYDELGKCTIRMEMTEWENQEARSDLENADNRDWLSAGYLAEIGSNRIWGSNTSRNVCTLLKITTDQGLYTATHLNYEWSPFEANIFTFEADRAKYQANLTQEGESKFWVLPLLNFIEKFMRGQRGQAQHPLRIYPVSLEALDFLKSDADKKEKSWVEHNLSAHNYLIAFNYLGEIGFIERLPNYEQSRVRLYKREIFTAQTAIMVGRAENISDELDPIDFLPVLGVAIGNEVSAPWIEFRDENRNLLERAHAFFGIPEYSNHRDGVDSLCEGGIEELITNASSSRHFGTSELRTIMRNYVASHANDTSIILFYTCAGLDVMHSYLNPEPLLLSPEQKKEIKSILNDASQDILSLKQSNSFTETQQDLLDAIAHKVRSQPLRSKKPEFGEQVIALLSYKGFDFKDKLVMDGFYASLGEELEFWRDLLTDYRNQTAHEAHYSTKRRELPTEKLWDEIMHVLLHLRDILLRCILRLLEYDGEYYPSMPYYPERKRLDWVNEDTKPRELGYMESE